MNRNQQSAVNGEKKLLFVRTTATEQKM